MNMTPSMMMMNNKMDRVLDHLFIGSMLCLTPNNIRNANIKLIIDCTIEGNGKMFPGVKRIQIPIDDNLSSNIASYFDLCADQIELTKRLGGNVLIHCVAGVSRSATICIAYLMKHFRMRLRPAYSMLKSIRSIIRPNESFFKQLIEYEFRLYGNNTVSMVNTTYGAIPDVYKTNSMNVRAPFNMVPSF